MRDSLEIVLRNRRRVDSTQRPMARTDGGRGARWTGIYMSGRWTARTARLPCCHYGVGPWREVVASARLQRAGDAATSDLRPARLFRRHVRAVRRAPRCARHFPLGSAPRCSAHKCTAPIRRAGDWPRCARRIEQARRV